MKAFALAYNYQSKKNRACFNNYSLFKCHNSSLNYSLVELETWR